MKTRICKLFKKLKKKTEDLFVIIQQTIFCVTKLSQSILV